MQSGASDNEGWWRKVSSRRLLAQRRSPLPLDVLVHLEATMPLSNGTTTFPIGASADNSWKVTINISRYKQARAVQLAACKGPARWSAQVLTLPLSRFRFKREHTEFTVLPKCTFQTL